MAHEQVLELVAARGLADLVPDAVADVHHLAGGEHVVEAEHEVAGVPVARPDQRPAAGADPSADQGARVRRRVVGIEQPVPGELLVELEHVDAGADGDGPVGEVELLDRVHPLDVDDDAPAQGTAPSVRPVPPSRGTTGTRRSLAIRTTPATSSVLVGSTARSGNRSDQRCTGNGAGPAPGCSGRAWR